MGPGASAQAFVPDNVDACCNVRKAPGHEIQSTSLLREMESLVSDAFARTSETVEPKTISESGDPT